MLTFVTNKAAGGSADWPCSARDMFLRDSIGATLLRAVLTLLKCSQAAVSPLTALMLIPISGAIAYSVEVGSWQYIQRSMQNAADSAALAAATNNKTTGVSTYLVEARAAAQKFGYVNGVGNTTVTAAPATCPTGTAAGSTCYQATVATVFPLMFSRVFGFNGNAAYGSGRGETITSTAIATAAGGGQKQVCVWSLGPTGVTFQSNGGPLPDMTGCTIVSDSSMTCTGHNLNADYGVAVGTDSGCGNVQISGGTAPTDPYSSLANNNIPSNAKSSCGGSFPQLTKVNGKMTVQASNQISGSKTLNGNQVYCGDVQLTGDVTLSGNSTLIIENGRLDLNGHTLATNSSSDSTTLVFSGDNSSTYSHYPMSSVNNAGTLNIDAPSSGAWKGVAIYQDPSLTTNVSFTYAGNQPTWDISGAVYLPKADVTFSGIVNKSSNGNSCFVLVVYTITVNGTGAIFAGDNGCGSGAPQVTVGPSTREKLVL